MLENTRRVRARAGVVVWVIYSRAEPFAGVHGDAVVAMIKADPTARHEIPAQTDPVAAGVIERCWAAEGDARPTFEAVSNELCLRYCSADVGGASADVYQ